MRSLEERRIARGQAKEETILEADPRNQKLKDAEKTKKAAERAAKAANKANEAEKVNKGGPNPHGGNGGGSDWKAPK